MKKILIPVFLFITVVVLLQACSEKDDVPPLLTIDGADSLEHVLNQTYIDAGASAYDETDGDISKSIYVDNTVDENFMGEYLVTYHVIDKAGNEASPVSRFVNIFNSARPFSASYFVTETNSIFPGQDPCSYNSFVGVDSALNYRIVFYSFACETDLVVYADITENLIVLPYQEFSDSLRNFSLQGSGSINDTLIKIEYRKTDSISSNYRIATFSRL